MPRPPKHVGSFSRSHAGSETFPPSSADIVCLSHQRWDQPKVTIQSTSNFLAHQHPRLHKADVVTCKSLDTLHRPKGLFQPLGRLCRRLSGLAQAHTHAVLHTGSRPKKADAEPFFAGPSHTGSGSPVAALGLQINCSTPGAHTPHLWPRSLWPAPAKVHSRSFQDRSSAAAHPMPAEGGSCGGGSGGGRSSGGVTQSS